MGKIKFKPNYVTAITPDVQEYYTPDLDKEYDEPLTTRYGTTEIVKGVVNPSKHSALRIPYPESVWHKRNPDIPLYMNYDQSTPGREYRDYLEGRGPAAELINPDGSNYKVGMSITKYAPFSEYYNQDRAINSDIQRFYVPARADVSTAKGAGEAIGDYNNLSEAMHNYRPFLRGNTFYDSWYSFYNLGDEAKKNDEQIIETALRNSGGDIKGAFEEAQDRVSSAGLRVLYSLLRYYDDPRVKNRQQAGDQVKARFFNAYDEANRYYNTAEGIPERDARYFNLQFATPEEKRAFYSQPSPQEEARLRGVNSYSRGGRLRVPKRNSYGDRLGRADGLGTDDYDVYF